MNEHFYYRGHGIESVYYRCHTILRERPFNLKGGGGGVWFFSKKTFLILNVAEKNILILVEENKNNLIQSFFHIT